MRAGTFFPVAPELLPFCDRVHIQSSPYAAVRSAARWRRNSLPEQREQSVHVFELFAAGLRLVQVVIDDRRKNERGHAWIAVQDL